jgi:hypothetical protein
LEVLLSSDNGWKVWGKLGNVDLLGIKSLYIEIENRYVYQLDEFLKKGDYISLSATISKTENDPYFGIFKRASFEII